MEQTMINDQKQAEEVLFKIKDTPSPMDGKSLVATLYMQTSMKISLCPNFIIIILMFTFLFRIVTIPRNLEYVFIFPCLISSLIIVGYMRSKQNKMLHENYNGIWNMKYYYFYHDRVIIKDIFEDKKRSETVCYESFQRVLYNRNVFLLIKGKELGYCLPKKEMSPELLAFLETKFRTLYGKAYRRYW